MIHVTTETLGDIVATDYRAAAVFEQFGLDFCCGGKRTIEEACEEQHVEPTRVVAALDALAAASVDDSWPTGEWPLDRVIDHILARHHAYVRRAIPVIIAHTEKIASVHGVRHPELKRVSEVFAGIAHELTLHMMKEEEILFPYIRSLIEAQRRGRAAGPSPFGTVQNPIRMMEAEHQDAGDELRELRELTNGFTVPDDGCATYRACFAELAEFERDLHVHIHLENNILFPASIELEGRVV